MNTIGVCPHFADGLIAQEFQIPAKTVLPTHSHPYSHLSILASGTVIVSVEGAHKEYTGPACLEIAANKQHTIVALTDAVWYCIHNEDRAMAAEHVVADLVGLEERI